MLQNYILSNIAENIASQTHTYCDEFFVHDTFIVLYLFINSKTESPNL